MINKLEPIVLQKQKEVAELYEKMQKQPAHPIVKILRQEFEPKQAYHFKQALLAPSLSVIAEIKRKSPSKGMLASIVNPVELAEQYRVSGANALSILTDQHFFNGHLDDLIQVATHVPSLPILRKDFIIDKIQIAEAAYAGAHAVLLIVAVLREKTKALLEFARSLKLDVLVEIHDLSELQIALDAGADIIGINNRNLNTFAVDTEQALRIVANIPQHITKVAESGISQPDLAKRYHEAGFDAVLIGEALVKSHHPKEFIDACRHD